MPGPLFQLARRHFRFRALHFHLLSIGGNRMNDFQRTIQSHGELQDHSAKSRLLSKRPGRKAAIYGLAILIVSVMAGWLGFLGWGFIAMAQWLWDAIKNLWAFF
jgi:hypothetical protein